MMVNLSLVSLLIVTNGIALALLLYGFFKLVNSFKAKRNKHLIYQPYKVTLSTGFEHTVIASNTLEAKTKVMNELNDKLGMDAYSLMDMKHCTPIIKSKRIEHGS